MNRIELIELIAKSSGEPKKEAAKSLKLVTDAIIYALSEGENINLTGFGSFSIKNRPSREGHNPHTGEKININSYKQLIFRASKRMKKAFN